MCMLQSTTFYCMNRLQMHYPAKEAKIIRASNAKTNTDIPQTAHSYCESLNSLPSASGSIDLFLPRSRTIIWIRGQRNTVSLPATADGTPSVKRIGICFGRNAKTAAASIHPSMQNIHPAFLPFPVPILFLPRIIIITLLCRGGNIENRMPVNGILFEVHLLIIFTFSSSFRFFLTSYAWLFIVFSLADLLLNASFSAVSFESA